MRSLLILWVACILVLPAQLVAQHIETGSKLFTESVILGEIATQLLESEGFEVTYTDQLGGTRILWNGIQQGELDIYPDYSGTLIQEVLRRPDIKDLPELTEEIRNENVLLTGPVGFDNTYALGMRTEQAKKLGIEKISDLARHPELKMGFSNEFLDRADGWKGLRIHYELPQTNVRGLDHDLAYRGLDNGDIDVTDLYSTDAEIAYYDLFVLEDDRVFFPEYEAVFVVREQTARDFPEIMQILKKLEGTIPESLMVSMNARVKLEKESEATVAADFLTQTLGTQTELKEDTLTERLIRTTFGHLYLVGISLGLAILCAIPLGIAAAKMKPLEGIILSVTGLLQTIPSLALLVFMIPLLGIGALPAMAALFLYSLLPVVRNTHSGITQIDRDLMESARALGLPSSYILRRIELPLALPTILAGIKTSAVINVGTATLGALIGAGGYGQPILTGIRLDSIPLILEGAIPAALLALLVQGSFDLLERLLVNGPTS